MTITRRNAAALALTVLASAGVVAGCKPTAPPSATAAPSRKEALPASAAAEAQQNPFPGQKLFVDPKSPARAQAMEWAASRAADAALMETIAAQPQAEWFGGWNADPKAAAAARVAEIRAAGALPVLVAQVHPACGGPFDDAYRAWVNGFAEGIGEGPAVVIFEPGALRAVDDCKTPEDKRKRIEMVAHGVTILTARPKLTVYVDGGGSTSLPADQMALRLMKAGIERARGFALNVAGHGSVEDEVAYGRQLSKLVRGRPFVVDTSRSGRGPAADGAWCNPADRGLGPIPTTATGDPLVDAFLWIKQPGTSDGTCNGGPPAGAWWPEGALTLAKNAVSAK